MLRAVSTRIFWSRFRARDGANLQMDALLRQIDAKLHRMINLAQSRARSRARKREQNTRVETVLYVVYAVALVSIGFFFNRVVERTEIIYEQILITPICSNLLTSDYFY
jgi:hypothetical protein